MRLPPNYATHFLYIPIGTRASSARLKDALSEIINDPLAAAIPRAAWLTVRELRYSIVSLRLQNKAQVNKAIHFLRSPEIRRVLEECQITTPTSPFSVATPKALTLRGLCIPDHEDEKQYDRVALLSACIQDSPFDLPRLRDRLRQCFADQQLSPYGTSHQISASWEPTVKIMHNVYLKTNALNTLPSAAKYGSVRNPLVDVRDLYMKYGNHVWAKDIDVDNLCISEVGLKDITRNGSVIGQGYRKVARVALPGISDEMLEPEDPEEGYIKAAKSKKGNHLMTRLWISLRPQSEAPDLSPRSASKSGKA